MSAEKSKVGEAKKPNLLQISEEESNRAETPDVSIIVDGNGTDAEKIAKNELNFHELWAQSHWRQFTSLMPGLVLLFASGTQIYWTIQELLYNSDDENDTAVLLWYIGAIIGGIIGARVVDKFLKSTIYYIGACLLIVSSVFFIKSNIGINLYCGRLLTGITHGIIHLVLLVHGCDNASKRSRASILRTVSYVLVFGTIFAICTNISYLKNGPLLSNRLIGVYLLGFAIFAVILTPTATNESVTYLIAHGREDEALQKYVQLRSERFPTTLTIGGFNEVKATVLADQELDQHIFHDGNAHPIFLISIARLLSLFIINIPLLVCLIRSNSQTTDDKLIEETQALIWLQVIRALFGFIPVMYCSALKRNQVLYRLGIVTGIVFLAMAGAIIYSDSVLHILRNTFAIGALFSYGGAALGIDAVQHVQSSEAFPLTKKPASLAFIGGVEHLCHIVLIVTYLQYFESHIAVYIILCAIGLIFAGVWLHQRMPVSSGLSLGEARDKYKT